MFRISEGSKLGILIIMGRERYIYRLEGFFGD